MSASRVDMSNILRAMFASQWNSSRTQNIPQIFVAPKANIYGSLLPMEGAKFGHTTGHTHRVLGLPRHPVDHETSPGPQYRRDVERRCLVEASTKVNQMLKCIFMLFSVTVTTLSFVKSYCRNTRILLPLTFVYGLVP